MSADLTTTLKTLKSDGVINFFRVDDDGDVVVSLLAEYINGDPNIGYADDTVAAQKRIDADLGARGLRFSDAGGEDSGVSNEYWIYRAARA